MNVVSMESVLVSFTRACFCLCVYGGLPEYSYNGFPASSIYCLFIVFTRNRMFGVKMSEISWNNKWTLSEIEWNLVKINVCLLNVIQCHSISLMLTHMFAKFHSILLKKTISSTNDEHPVNWNCGKPLAWSMLPHELPSCPRSTPSRRGFRPGDFPSSARSRMLPPGDSQARLA